MTDQEYAAWLRGLGLSKNRTPVEQLRGLLLLHKVFDDFEYQKKNPKKEELMN